MAAATPRPKAGDKLEDQAATAALYVTKGQIKGTSKPILDENKKLSSAGAASSLKYAQPTDLPSYPSAGLKLSSAGAAASLANKNQKSSEHWHMEPIPNANKAANMAKDYQMDPLWQPEASSAGSKAALLAHRGGANVKAWKPEESEYGHSAAEQAMRKKGLSPTVERGVDKEAGHRALLAATGAMSGNRKRSDSAPVRQDSGYALSAAMSSQKAVPKKSAMSTEMSDPANDASRIHNIAKNNVNRELYGSKPPVAIELEEKRREDTLRAAAVSMAKQMYNIQQSMIDDASGVKRSDSHYAATNVHNRRLSTASEALPAEEPKTYPQYVNLQEAARKLAAERLAKLEDSDSAYKKYYGQQNQPSRSRLSMRMRRRASSDGQLDVDAEQSKKIRSQMSMFQSQLAEVDQQKRQKDRQALLAAAQRNVKSSMHDMDERVFHDTGKSSPAMRQEWEAKAREKAQRESEERMVNHGRVHIGGGKYLDQADVDAIAKSRIQPTLDEINEKAQEHHAHQEMIRLDEEQKKHQAEVEKARAAEMKADQKRAKELEKKDEKFRKESEKARKAEEKRKQQEEQETKEAQVAVPTTASAEGGEDLEKTTTNEKEDDPMSPNSSRNIKSWFRGHFKRDSKPSNEDADEPVDAKPEKRSRRKSLFGGDKDKEKRSSFAGGAALTGASVSTESVEKDREDSLREVAMAGRQESNRDSVSSVYEVGEPSSSAAPPVVATRSRSSSSVSSLSSSSSSSNGTREKETVTPNASKRLSLKERFFKRGRTLSKSQDTKGKGAVPEDTANNTKDEDVSDDDFEEARDTIASEPLSPPMTLKEMVNRDKKAALAENASPHRETKFVEGL